MTPLQQIEHNQTLRHDTETLLEYVIRRTDHYLLQESETEYIRRTGRSQSA